MGTFTLDDLIACYRQGIFPMADDRDDESLFLVDPPLRGILPLEGLHIPARLRRTLRNSPYQIRIDTDFTGLIRLCAEAVNNRPTTWISHGIESLYCALFSRGLAHSVEVYDQETLVGGLYGVVQGGAFFGESMVSRARDASKIALIYLVARLIAGGFSLLDCQFSTDHLKQFGVIDIDRDDYRARLHEALSLKGDFYALPSASDAEAVLSTIEHFK